MFLICFVQFFSIKCPKTFSPLRSLITCPRPSILNFFNNKSFCKPIWNVIFCKNILIFCYSDKIANFRFRIFIINFFIKVNIHVGIYISRLHFSCSMTMYCCIYQLFHLIYQYTHFSDTEVMYLLILSLKVLINLSKQQIFLHYSLNTFICHYTAKMISLIYFKIQILYLTICCFGCWLDYFNFSEKWLVNVTRFLSFKAITHAYLLKISKTHTKKQIPLLNLLINCISARSAPQIFSIKANFTFPF